MRSISILVMARFSDAILAFRLMANSPYTLSVFVFHMHRTFHAAEYLLVVAVKIMMYVLLRKGVQHQTSQNLQCHTTSPLGILPCNWAE